MEIVQLRFPLSSYSISQNTLHSTAGEVNFVDIQLRLVASPPSQSDKAIDKIVA